MPVERASPDSIASGASDEQFCIKFTPSMDGLHSVAVFECNGSEIEGYFMIMLYSMLYITNLSPKYSNLFLHFRINLWCTL